MAIFGILLLVITPILLVAALAVRFAGNRRVLNSIDYSSITDLAGLNRWAGNRLSALPLVSFLFGATSLSHPALSIIGCGSAVLVGVLVVVWIAVGSDRFQSKGTKEIELD